MTIALPATIDWRHVDADLWTGTVAGDHAGIIDHVHDRYIATDGTGTIVGTFPDESSAMASLEPDALERRLAARGVRDKVLSVVTAGAAGVAMLLAATAMVGLLG